MRFRIGYGGPPGLEHGYRRPADGRGMSEFERLIHLIASMQILFGSRRGSLLIPVVVIAIGVGGWFMYKNYYGPDRRLERAHQMWESGDSKKRIKAIGEYKLLLREKDPIDSTKLWLSSDRELLYRRIIRFHVKYDTDKDAARDWIIRAWDENMRKPSRLRFQDEEVKKFWTEVTDDIKKNRSQGKFDLSGVFNSSSFSTGYRLPFTVNGYQPTMLQWNKPACFLAA